LIAARTGCQRVTAAEVIASSGGDDQEKSCAVDDRREDHTTMANSFLGGSCLGTSSEPAAGSSERLFGNRQVLAQQHSDVSSKGCRLERRADRRDPMLQ
jgi:hypothetical protein